MTIVLSPSLLATEYFEVQYTQQLVVTAGKKVADDKITILAVERTVETYPR
jgi:hypothetical protein